MWNVSPYLPGGALLLCFLAGCPDDGGLSVTEAGPEAACPDIVPRLMDAPAADAPKDASVASTPDQGAGVDLAGPGCALPIQRALVLTGGKVSVTGEIQRSPTNNLVTLPGGPCHGAGGGCADLGVGPDLGSAAGPQSKGTDHFYSVTLAAGTDYWIYLHPEGGHDTVGYNAMVYAFTDCTCPATSCVGKADQGHSGQGEVLGVKPQTGGTTYVGVDSHYVASHPGSYGKYTLTVMARQKPANDTCGAARPLAFAAGSDAIVEHGHTGDATNTVGLQPAGCTGGATAGPDVFYSVAMKRGKTYTIRLDGVAFDEALYVFRSCGDAAGTCGKGMGADALVAGPEQVILSPDKDGTYIIGVDGKGAADHGAFALQIDAHDTPANDTCAGRQLLAWEGDKAAANGDTTKALDRLSFADSAGCAGSRAAGPELFYGLPLAAGKTYRVAVTPGAGYDPAVYLFGDCAAVQSSCLGSADAAPAGSPEVLRVTPRTAGTYVLAVDARGGAAADVAGAFRVEVTEVVPPQNDACAGATTLSWCGGRAAAHGDTTRASAAVDLTAAGCTRSDTEGADLFYAVSLRAHRSYTVTLTPAAGFNAALYVLDRCDAGARRCLVGADIGAAGAAERLTLSVAQAGTYIIAVDSQYPVGSGPFAGTFVLGVKEK